MIRDSHPFTPVDAETAPTGRDPAAPVIAVLSLLLVVLTVIPSRLVFRPLGGAGTPAEMLGVVLFGYWACTQLLPGREPMRQRMRLPGLVFGAAVLASYVAAATRPIAANELRAADLGLISAAAWLGIMSASADAPRSLDDLDMLLRRLTYLGGGIATLGLLQFAIKRPFTNYIQIPGLSVNNELVSVLDRGGLTRPAGTALHPIEFGAVLTMILPIALHYAFEDRHRGLLSRWYPVAAIALAIPVSISRSAIVSAAVVLLVLVPTWAPPVRRRAYVCLLSLVAVVYVAVPSLVGTLTGLFTGISQDSSAASRTGSYSLAWEFIARAPVFGRGFRTFLPDYRILDNQYLGTTIEMGLLGLVALLALFVVGVRSARRVRVTSVDSRNQRLAQSLLASTVATGCSFALYDAFSFPMAASLLFFVLGAVGALERLTLTRRASIPVPVHVGWVPRSPTPSGSNATDSTRPATTSSSRLL